MNIIANVFSKEQLSFDIAIVADNQINNGSLKLSRIKRLNSNKLFSNVKELMIDHESETYILRITKQNKLILTK